MKGLDNRFFFRGKCTSSNVKKDTAFRPSNSAICVLFVVQREHPLVFAGGMLKPGVEKEVPNRQKRWAVPAGAQGNAAFIHDK